MVFRITAAMTLKHLGNELVRCCSCCRNVSLLQAEELTGEYVHVWPSLSDAAN